MRPVRPAPGTRLLLESPSSWRELSFAYDRNSFREILIIHARSCAQGDSLGKYARDASIAATAVGSGFRLDCISPHLRFQQDILLAAAGWNGECLAGVPNHLITKEIALTAVRCLSLIHI